MKCESEDHGKVETEDIKRGFINVKMELKNWMESPKKRKEGTDPRNNWNIPTFRSQGSEDESTKDVAQRVTTRVITSKELSHNPSQSVLNK